MQSSDSYTDIPEGTTFLDLSHHPHEYIGVSYSLPSSLKTLELMNCRLKGICNLEHLVNLEYLGLRKNQIGMILDTEHPEHPEHPEHIENIERKDVKNNEDSDIITNEDGMRPHDGNMKVYNEGGRIHDRESQPSSQNLVNQANTANSESIISQGASSHTNVINAPVVPDSNVNTSNENGNLTRHTTQGNEGVVDSQFAGGEIPESLQSNTSTWPTPIFYNGADWGKGIGHLINLKELDLYDNEITKIPDEINCLVNLEKLDLSFNKIRKMNPLDGKRLKSLRELFLVSNKIKKMIDFSDFERLENLELGSNRIRKISGLENGMICTTLKQLWLGKNKISKIFGLENLKNLKSLSLQSNRIIEISNLESLTTLEQLYLSENDIGQINNLDTLQNLQVLDLSYNKKLNEIQGLSSLTQLEEFWFSSNSLSNFSELEKLSQHSHLIDIYLQGNPISRDTQYRRKVLLILPQLENIDGFPVSLMKEKNILQ